MCKDVSWEDYASDLREVTCVKSKDVYCKKNVDKMVEEVTEWIQEVNARHAKKRASQSVRRMRWSMKELNHLKRQVQKSRKAVMNEYTYRLRKVKQENWR